jgi:hypothetical protein
MRTREFTTALGATLYTHIAALGNAVFAMAAVSDRRDLVGMANLSTKIHTT